MIRKDKLSPAGWTTFFWRFLQQPRQVGAIASCSEALAASMARALYHPIGQERSDLGGSSLRHVVELGPGTGRITAYLHGEPLTLVEIDPAFCELLTKRYKKADVLNMSAVDFLLKQRTPIDVVTSIPLLNNPHASDIKAAIGQAYRAGIIRKLVTYSYGPLSPLACCGFASQARVDRVLRTLPPANVWVYT